MYIMEMNNSTNKLSLHRSSTKYYHPLFSPYIVVQIVNDYIQQTKHFSLTSSDMVVGQAV